MSEIDCKVVIIGNASTGKTCLLQRYVHGTFNSRTQATIGGAFCAKKEQIDKTSVSLGCWDTAGSERYASMSKIYYRGAQAAVICFDLTDMCSYNDARRWVAEILETQHECKMYLCGTKLDLLLDDASCRAVDYDKAREFAQDLQADYFETSSITGQNIDKMFKKIAKDFSIRENEDACHLNAKFCGHGNSITSTSWRMDPRVKRRDASSCCSWL